MHFDHDVLVLGGGSAGYAAARTARAAGADVAIADPGPLGGLCILRGCMPSKAILRSADVASLMRRAREDAPYSVTVDLEACQVTDSKGLLASFTLDPFRRKCLLEGLDRIGLTLRHEARIAAYETGIASR